MAGNVDAIWGRLVVALTIQTDYQITCVSTIYEGRGTVPLYVSEDAYYLTRSSIGKV